MREREKEMERKGKKTTLLLRIRYRTNAPVKHKKDHNLFPVVFREEEKGSEKGERKRHKDETSNERKKVDVVAGQTPRNNCPKETSERGRKKKRKRAEREEDNREDETRI